MIRAHTPLISLLAYTMIKICFIFLYAFLFNLSVLHAQFINFQIKIEAELSATVERDLNFGTQISNSGRTEIQLGDINMGVFSIRAYHTQNVYLNLQYPSALTNNNPAVNATIPLELNIAYNNTGNNAVESATPLPGNNGLVSVHERTELRNKNDIWKQLYLYIYGAIEVGDIPNGVYTGDILLSVDYD